MFLNQRPFGAKAKRPLNPYVKVRNRSEELQRLASKGMQNQGDYFMTLSY